MRNRFGGGEVAEEEIDLMGSEIREDGGEIMRMYLLYMYETMNKQI